ncbi:MAG: hypothetical protein ACYS9X_33110, partial [Planctomycetota bacterium]
RPAIERVDIELRYPGYAGGKREKIENARDEQRDVRAPVGTLVLFTVKANRPVTSASLEIADSTGIASEALSNAGAARGLQGSVNLAKPSERRYAIRLVDETGATDDAPVWHDLVALPDRPPKVTFVAPARNVELPPGATVSLVLRATDDYGLTRVKALFRRNKEGEERELRSWAGDDLGARTDTALSYKWQLKAGEFAAGDLVTYRAVAYDRVDSRAGESSRWEVRIVDPREKKRKVIATLQRLLAAVEAIARTQEQAQAMSRRAKETSRGDLWRLAAARQTAVRDRTLKAITESQGSAETDVALVRAVLRRLAAGDMARAVVTAEHLAARSKEGDAKALDALQTKILAALRRLLGVIPKAIEKAKKEDLPDDEASDLSRRRSRPSRTSGRSS